MSHWLVSCKEITLGHVLWANLFKYIKIDRTVQPRLSEPRLSERSIIRTNRCSRFYDIIANNSSMSSLMTCIVEKWLVLSVSVLCY